MKVLEFVKSLLYLDGENVDEKLLVEMPLKGVVRNISVAISDSEYLAPLVVDNKIISDDFILEKVNEFFSNRVSLIPAYLFRCKMCGRYYDRGALVKISRPSEIKLKLVRMENIIIILPMKSTIHIPEIWYKLDLQRKSIYLDGSTYHLIKDFIKRGKKVDLRSLEIVFGKSIKELLFFSDFDEEIIMYQASEFRCPHCGGEVNKIPGYEIDLDGLKIGKMKDSLILLNEYGKLILSKELTNAERVYVLSKKIDKRKLVGFNFEIKKVKLPSRSLIWKLTGIYRSFSYLNSNIKPRQDEVFFTEAKGFFMEAANDIIKSIENGRISRAYEEFYHRYRAFSRLFLNASKRLNNYHISAAIDFKNLFEEIFMGTSSFIMPNYKVDYNYDFRSFLSLFLELERVKSLSGGRGIRYRDLVISTEMKLPPVNILKQLFNVDNVLIIKGFWHGLKFKVVPDMEKLGRYYRSYYASIKAMLSKKDGSEILKKLNSGGYVLGIEGQEIRIMRDMVNILVDLPKGYVKGTFNGGEFYLNTEMGECDKQVQRIIRTINFQRKLLKLEYKDYIDAWVDTGSCREISPIDIDYIKSRVRAMRIISEYGKETRIKKVNINELRRAISKLIGTEKSEIADKYIIDGCRNVMDIIEGKVGDQESISKALENAKVLLQNIKANECPLCEGRMENGQCPYCGLDINKLR